MRKIRTTKFKIFNFFFAFHQALKSGKIAIKEILTGFLNIAILPVITIKIFY